MFSFNEIRTFITYMARDERWSSGAFDECVKDGTALRVAKRLKELTYEDDEEDSWDDDDEEEDVELPSDQEELAEEIAEDISNKKYAIESLYGLYSEDFIKRIKKLID